MELREGLPNKTTWTDRILPVFTLGFTHMHTHVCSMHAHAHTHTHTLCLKRSKIRQVQGRISKDRTQKEEI